MQDLFFETIAVQRMALMSRLVSVGACNQEEKAIALEWLAELSAELLESFAKYDGHQQSIQKNISLNPVQRLL
ncbi:hypothetical protein ACQZ19_13640 [Rahnella variigena]|uniref:hypothetical protein n=1 Tax=Rahnella variigena TaxID=574964 RepID=UPI003D2A3B2A